MELIGEIALPVSLWFIMYSMGLSLTPGDFRRVFVSRKALLVGVCSMMVVLPLIGLALAIIFAPNPTLAVGFVLLATCPGGMLSNLMTDIAEGDLALSLSMSIFVSTVYLMVIPFYAYAAINYFLGADTSISVPFMQSVVRIFSITLVPVTLGLATRAYSAQLADRLKPFLKNGATMVLVIAFGYIIFGQLETLRQTFGTLLVMVITLNACALLLAFSLCALSKLSNAETRAICIEHLIRQEGTAIYVAVTIMGVQEMALPMIINTPVALVFCIAFVIASKMASKRHIRLTAQ
jgi:bile acid:Na+ symporter, BASS family